MKGRLWLNDGSCVRLRPERPNRVWSYDFLEDRTHDGRKFRTLNIIDEFTREALVIRVDRKLNSTDVVDALTDLFILRGPPEFIRFDNGPEFIAEKVRGWIGAVGAKTAFIEPGSPWENGYCEVVQLPVPRRAPQQRDLLLASRGPDPDRTVAPPLQYGPAAQRPRIPATGSGKLHPNGPEADHALTIQPDHSMGAVQAGFDKQSVVFRHVLLTGSPRMGCIFEILLEILFESNQIIRKGQAQSLHFRELLPQRFLKFVHVLRLVRNGVQQHRQLHLEFLEGHELLLFSRCLQRPLARDGCDD